MPKDLEPVLAELRSLIESAKKSRLPSADERRGAELFRDIVLAGGKTLTAGLELLPEMPWFMPVQGTVEAWPQLTPTRQRSYLSLIRKVDSELGRRTRLSVARGLMKIDAAAGVRLATATLDEMQQPSGLNQRDRQTVFHVFVGKNKPWILQIDLGAIKPTELRVLAECLLECTGMANPPASISLIRWAKPYSDLTKLPEPSQLELAKVFRKWSSRWRRELAELDLPPIIKEAVAARPETVVAKPASKPAEEEVKPRETPPRSFAKTKPLPPERTENHQREQRIEPGVRQLLKQIEDRFHSLQTELNDLKRRNRQPQSHAKVDPAHSAGDELVKLRHENQQLTQTVFELRAALSDLATTDFEEAISRRSETGEPLTDPVAQYRSLLTLRLGETITQFQEMNRDNQRDALPLLIENLLVVLEQNGIDLSGVTAPPAPARRRY